MGLGRALEHRLGIAPEAPGKHKLASAAQAKRCACGRDRARTAAYIRAVSQRAF